MQTDLAHSTHATEWVPRLQHQEAIAAGEESCSLVIQSFAQHNVS